MLPSSGGRVLTRPKYDNVGNYIGPSAALTLEAHDSRCSFSLGTYRNQFRKVRTKTTTKMVVAKRTIVSITLTLRQCRRSETLATSRDVRGSSLSRPQHWIRRGRRQEPDASRDDPPARGASAASATITAWRQTIFRCFGYLGEGSTWLES